MIFKKLANYTEHSIKGNKMTVKPREKPEDPDDDPVESMLKKTGCLELHYKVQECIATTKDWRKCQTEVNDFRDCINKQKKTDNKS